MLLKNLFLLIFIVDYGIQLIFGTLSILLQTEKFYDAIGSITFVICALLGLFYDTDVAFKAKLIQVLALKANPGDGPQN